MGRARELDELRTCLEEAMAGRGRLILVSGEPGIGKTRLAEQLSDDARAAGAEVVWGRCWEGDGSPAFWPWVQVIRALAGLHPVSELDAGGALLAGIVPEIAAKLRHPTRAPASPESEGSRFYLFDAIATFLRRVAEERPLVIVLDDLHWADRSSLVLLEFAAQQMREARILAIGTHREGESRAGAPVAEVLGGAARRLPLRGLSEAEVALLMERHGGKSPDPSLVAAVYGSTDGNPFFVDEIVRLLAAEGISTVGPGESLPIPEGVSATIARRMKLLPEACQGLLSLAAVVGREFDAETLARASGAPRDDVVALLRSAVGSALVTKIQGARFRFAHALVRETLYESLDGTTQAKLHEQVGLALEELHRSDPDSRLAELAYHFAGSAAAGLAAKAVDYARRAGEKALAMLAFEEAARLFEVALRVLGTQAPGHRLDRCRLLLGLGEARLGAGDLDASIRISLEVVDQARKLDAPELLASAALQCGIASQWSGRMVDAVSVLDEALAALKEEDSALRAHLLSRLAVALAFRDSFTGSPERRASLVREAVAMARRIGDPLVLANAQWSRLEALEDPENAAERVDAATEMAETAGRSGDRALVFGGHYHRLANLLVLGDIRAVDSGIETCARLAREWRKPLHVAYTTMSRAMRALHDGLLDESERLANEGLAIAGQMRSALIGAQLRDLVFVIRTERDRLAEIEPILVSRVGRYPGDAGSRASLVFLLTELGREREARVALERLDTDAFAGLPRADKGFFTVAARLTDVAASHRDRRLAARLYDRLLPYASLNLTFGAAAVSLGATSRFLGVLAATLGRPDEAAAHFEDALRENARMGAVPWLAHTRLEYARLLFARDDTARASALLAEAVETARALGMKRLLRRAEGLGTAISGATSPPPDWSRDREPSIFRRDGAHWTISHQGVVFRLKDSRGLRAIAHLLRHPGLECHVAELVALVEGASELPRPDAAALAAEGLHAGGLGDAGAHLDATAKAAYRARLEDLREELEEALRNNDTGRAGRAREEIDFLGEELSRAVGLGGRDRKAAAATERARLNVTRAIRGAIDKIAGFSAPLAACLSGAIRTGTYCSYHPPADDPVSWDLGD